MAQAQGFSALIDWVCARILWYPLHPTPNINTYFYEGRKHFIFNSQ